MNWKDARLQLVLLALVFGGAMLHYWAGARNAIVQGVEHASYPAVPIYTEIDGSVIGTNSTYQSVVHIGDRLIAINGTPYHGQADMFDALSGAHVGDVMNVEIQRKDGTPAKLPLKLVPRLKPPFSPLGYWLYHIPAVLVLPLFCILIGAWVVFARPRLLSAWWMFGILLYLPQAFAPTSGFGRPLLYFLTPWEVIIGSVAVLCAMLFGLYFPQRSPVDIKLPWLKYVLAVPILVSMSLLTCYHFLRDFHIIAAPTFVRVTQISGRVALFASICVVFLFIFALRANMAETANPDARRRLRVLLYGAVIGMTPVLFIVVWAATHGGNFGDDKLPYLVVLASVLLTFIFPLTLGYVVVVQRAMDVRILLRQGTQYALARGTLTAIRTILGGLVGLSIFYGLKYHMRPVDQVRSIALVALFLTFRFRFADRITVNLDRRFFREAYSAELMLAELSEEARSFTETEPLLKTITHRLSETLHIDRIAVLLRNGHTFHLQQAVGLNGSIPVPVLLADSSQTIRNLNREHRPATIFHDNPDGWLFLATEQERRLLRELDSEVLLPLPGRTKLVGVISLGPKRSEEPYSRADLQMLQSVAMQTGLAIENSELIGSLAREASQRERLNREIEIAREVQERLLPQTFPQLTGLECSGFCRPAQGVGGDYYDFIMTARGCLGIAIGDVSGKGISAALLMAGLRASLRAVTMAGTDDLSALMRSVNHLVFEASADNRYATFFFGVYDPSSQILDYVNAGHNAPFIVRPLNPADGTCDRSQECQVLRLEEGGPVVGLLEGAQYLGGRVKIIPGDVLVAFTDGISEAMNRRDDEWSEERLIAAACKCTQKSAGEIVQSLIEEADTFTDGAPQHDDMTLAVVKLA